ncbi:hypothetical protein LOAG_04288 [Loa loa]|uniref:Uncharacterized protein n=1 Tax=Loa loa TaxID=7209 RepID=A0A1S0U274_LOALO|nr:hypothetical protein LOAG_04288 [Loa loa]EFO24198.1 hypothetical protein LOAG_04288 [Loa loa]
MLPWQVQYFRCLFWYGLLTVSLSYSIYNFIILETRSGTLLEVAQLSDGLVYKNITNKTLPVIVILLTTSPSQNFKGLKSLLPADVKYIHDRRDAYKLKTPQVHVLIQPTHSTVLPGFIKFMASIKKMNVSDVAKFVMLSIEIEKYIISPNIDKVLCFPNQQVILMNTVLGNYHSFTIYVANLDESKNVKNLTDEMSGNVGLTRMIAKELLNPVRCDLMFFGVISNDV